MRAKMDRMILSASKNRLRILLFHRERRWRFIIRFRVTISRQTFRCQLNVTGISSAAA